MKVGDIGVFVGIDVGKCEHRATAVTRQGKKVFDKALPNDEARLRALYETLACHGRLLVVVDQVRHHRRPGTRPRPGHGYHSRLPSRPVHEAHRRPDTR